MPVMRFVALATLSIGVAFLSIAPLPAKAGLILVVNSTADTADSAPGDGACDSGGVCTLRAAIEEANAGSGADTINFSIGSGVQTISPRSFLPAIFDDLTIDGTTQPGFAGSPIIELEGSHAGPNAPGLNVPWDTARVIIRGLVINRFDGSGIGMVGGPGSAVEGNFIGTDAAGTSALGNSEGIFSIFSKGLRIGGTDVGARNLISGNRGGGIFISQSQSNVVVQGNYVGTDKTGTAALGNAFGGIFVDSFADTIGGSEAGAGNVISGNGGNANAADVVLSAGSTTVKGNRIGTNAAGTDALPSSDDGILVMSPQNVIGGANPGEGNLISGHTAGAGISISVDVAEGNTIQDNYIGTDASGTSALPNHWGVLVSGNNNTVGGTGEGAGNVISGNSADGVTLGLTLGNVVQGNFIGTDASGHNALGNGNGVSLFGFGAEEPLNNVIGGETAGARNIISGNIGSGIFVDESPGNQLQGNYIGTDVTGTVALGNQEGVLVEQARDNLIGGETAGAGNLISGNQFGVFIFGGSNNKVQGNFVGTNNDGTAALGNRFAGVSIDRFSETFGGHLIGGSSPAARNVISGNLFGVSIRNQDGNSVQGNYIGTDVTGEVPLANTASGVIIDQGSGNVIGGESAETGNVISGNAEDGILIFGASFENKLQGNFIGTNAAGTAPVGSQWSGIDISGFGSNFVGNNLIGGRTPDARNLISGNQTGLRVRDSGGNAIEGNYIGTDVSGTRGLSGITGVFLLADGNTVGGTAPGTPNVISGYEGEGVRIEGSSNAVWGNYIGTDAGGTSPIPNGNGVSIFDASNNAIGGVEAGEPNVIAFNAGNGVDVRGPSATGNAIRANSIYSSLSSGIETQNGGNLELPPPVIKSAGSAAGTACAGCVVDVYSDDEDEGRTYHGSTTADANGNWSFAGAVVGPNVTATATDATGNTSEFSAPFALGRHDAAAQKISVPQEGQPASPIEIRVQNLSEQPAVIGVYADVMPPGGTSNPYGCTSGRVIEESVTLAPGQKMTVSSADITFACADAVGARGKKYTVVAVADVRGDDVASCGEGQLQSMACYSALADDDANPANNRISRTCCKTH